MKMNNKIKKAWHIYRICGFKRLIKEIILLFKKSDNISSEVSSAWLKKINELKRNMLKTRHCHRYFDLIRCLAGHPIFFYKVIPLFSIPLLLRSVNIVEFGSAFTYYPAKYDNPWGRYDKLDEGFLSARVLLTACRFLNKIGIKSSLTSVDIRSDEKRLQDCKKHLHELGLIDYWKPFYGIDSLEWLKKNKEPIDLIYVDSSHAYKHVKAELQSLSAMMKPGGVIVMDDGFTINDSSRELWRINEDDEGRSKGGEFGAISFFLNNHPEWHSAWSPEGMVYLCRDESLIKLLL